MSFFFRLLCKFHARSLQLFSTLVSYVAFNVGFFGRYILHVLCYCHSYMHRFNLFIILIFISFLSMYTYGITNERLAVFIPDFIIRFLFCLFVCTACSYFLYFVHFLFAYIVVLLGVFKYGNLTKLPAKDHIMTLLRSPHVDKKARDQYVVSEFRCGAHVFKLPSQLYYIFACQSISGIGLKVKCIAHTIW